MLQYQWDASRISKRIQLLASELRVGYRYFVGVTGFRPDRLGTEQYRSRITEAWRFRSTTIVRTGDGETAAGSLESARAKRPARPCRTPKHGQAKPGYALIKHSTALTTCFFNDAESHT